MLVGADVGRLRELADTMDNGAERLTEAAATIDNQLAGEFWTGPDAAEFREPLRVTWKDEAVLIFGSDKNLVETKGYPFS